MKIHDFNKIALLSQMNALAGLEHIGNGENKAIDNYFQIFKAWLQNNQILTKLNQYSKKDITLEHVSTNDFLVWLLHYGDVYDNLLRQCLKNDPLLDYHAAARTFYHLRQFHPKFSFTVALTSQLPRNQFLSDNDLNKLFFNESTPQIYQAMIDSLEKLEDFATEKDA
ncbi:hypothetical protein [Companilactobacillus sp. FL22-1]|uniref:hypothetical protein n=1 Tax=Companilactobacillus sp. FL22-1 TaxID=3373892 RepID=UPI0037551AB6